MKPTIPGFQNSWQPSVYPVPQTAPAAPPSLDPSSVYSFGQPWHTPNTMLNGDGPQTIMAEAPKSPAAPGYLGPASAMAYQMAGPRVGFNTISLPGPSQAAPSPSSTPIGSGGGLEGMTSLNPVPGVSGYENYLNDFLSSLYQSGVPFTNGTQPTSYPPGSGISLPSLSDLSLGGLFGAYDIPQSGSLPGGTPTLSGQPMNPSPGQWSANLIDSQAGAPAPDYGYGNSQTGGTQSGISIGGGEPSGSGLGSFGTGGIGSYGGLGGSNWLTGNGDGFGAFGGGWGSGWNSFGGSLGGGFGGGGGPGSGLFFSLAR